LFRSKSDIPYRRAAFALEWERRRRSTPEILQKPADFSSIPQIGCGKVGGSWNDG